MGFTLTFSKGNNKLKATARFFGLHYNQVMSVSIPAGYTCPAANICLTWADRDTGRLSWGENSTVTCFMAKVEGYSPNARRAYWWNWKLLRGCKNTSEMTDLILRSFEKYPKIQYFRIHAGGDFYHRSYFDAWLNVVHERSDITFFGYTKMLPYAEQVFEIGLDNLFINYSYGGLFDNRLPDWMPTSYIVKSPEEAEEMGVPLICVDHSNDAAYSEDFRLIMARQSFALLEH
jgi:hypothetical protein